MALVAGAGAIVLAAGTPAFAAAAPTSHTQSASAESTRSASAGSDAEILSHLQAEGEALRRAELAGPQAGPTIDSGRSALAGKALAASSDACGSACDGQDPATYLVKPPGGQANWYHCSADAKTIYTAKSGDGHYQAELRYSPRCRTAWTRGCCYTTYAGFSYSGSKERLNVKAGCASCGSSVYTEMLNDAGFTFKACWNRVIAGDGAEWQCTKKY